MTPDELHNHIESGEIDTVIVAFTDHYGRAMGKRFDAEFFVETIDDGTHACDYLLTVDIDMEPVEGFSFANWEHGYGDFHLVPDLATLRRCGWAPNSALVLCDVVDDATHSKVLVAPRTMLANQTARAAEMGFRVMAASELEFFLYRDSYRTAHDKGYTDLTSSGWYNEDYHLLQGARVEDYVGAARKMLRSSEVPVENSKGEAAIGQHELNIRYAEALTMADRHVVMKHAMKELAEQQGVAVTFMAKPHFGQSGSSCHIHLSLWQGDASGGQDGVLGEPAFSGPDGPTDLFRWFLGGWMAHTADLAVCYAPTVNSYKRFQNQSWAPTSIAWSSDNRTVGFRVVGSGPSLRIECRIPGADTNPYLAYAAAIASGLDGIENRIEPPAEFSGDGYSSANIDLVPATLAEALGRFRSSADARRLLGDEVVDHYSHHFGAELAAYEGAVTDWELKRYFERI